MNAPILRLKHAINQAMAHSGGVKAEETREKLEGILASIELAFAVKDRALRESKSVIERHNLHGEIVSAGKGIGTVIDEALMPWSHNSDEVDP